jgi:histone deacetylase 1/2
VFGCACFPFLTPYNQSKLKPISQEFIILGYSQNHPGYKCLSREGRIYISKDVLFNGFKFLYPSMFYDSITTPNTIQCSSLPICCLQYFPYKQITLPQSHTPINTSPNTYSSHQQIIHIVDNAPLAYSHS